jgi:hypothetical protein
LPEPSDAWITIGWVAASAVTAPAANPSFKRSRRLMERLFWFTGWFICAFMVIDSFKN